MNALKCAIVDDEPLARKVLKDYISQIKSLDLIAEFKSAIELKEYMANNSLDVIFIDINMPMLTGVDYVKSFQPEAHIIFTTAYPEYAVDAFELKAKDYLVKPIPFDRFLKCVDDIIGAESSSDSKQYLIIKENKRLYKLNLEEIKYIQAYGDYVKVITSSKNHITKEKLSEIKKSLNGRFVQSHRSYIVNIDHVEYIEGNHLQIMGEKIPVSASYRVQLLSSFS